MRAAAAVGAAAEDAARVAGATAGLTAACAESIRCASFEPGQHLRDGLERPLALGLNQKLISMAHAERHDADDAARIALPGRALEA